MSDKPTIPQKPPFEKTWQYQLLLTQWKILTDASIEKVQKSDVPASWKEHAINKLRTSTEAFDKSVFEMRQRYDRDEL